jgi:hypothetical protein
MLIVHLHAFKCAGSTFSWILEKNFPGSVLYVESKNPSKRLRWSEIQNILKNRSHIKAITSHLLECPPINTNNSYLIVELIRNPINRYLSAYRFQKKVGQIKAETSFQQYLQAHRDTIRANFMSRHLSPQYFNSEEGKQQGWMLNNDAIDLNRDDLFVGTVEKFDESMVLLEILFQSKGIPLDLSYPQAQNISSQEDDATAAFDEITEDLRNSLTCEDTDLMAKVNINLDAKIGKVSGFDDLLQAYRDRCSALINCSVTNSIRTPPPAKWKYVH